MKREDAEKEANRIRKIAVEAFGADNVNVQVMSLDEMTAMIEERKTEEKIDEKIKKDTIKSIKGYKKISNKEFEIYKNGMFGATQYMLFMLEEGAAAGHVKIDEYEGFKKIVIENALKCEKWEAECAIAISKY